MHTHTHTHRNVHPQTHTTLWVGIAHTHTHRKVHTHTTLGWHRNRHTLPKIDCDGEWRAGVFTLRMHHQDVYHSKKLCLLFQLPLLIQSGHYCHRGKADADENNCITVVTSYQRAPETDHFE
jgi:hypothetical protein